MNSDPKGPDSQNTEINDLRRRIKNPPWKEKVVAILLKVEGWISNLRRKIGIDAELRFFLAQPLRQADRFLKKLYPNDEFYRSARYAWTSPDDSRKLYLYGCGRQVVKAQIMLMENAEHIQGAPPNDADGMARTITEALIDAQNIVIRRHIELLINLINFSTSNRGEEYRIFLNAENLNESLGRQADFQAFYESTSENTKHSARLFAERIQEDLKTLGLRKTWFLRDDWERAMANAQPVFNSIRQRYKDALIHADDDEKIVLGLTYYDFFSDISVSAHADAGSRTSGRHYNFKALKKNISTISLLGQHIMHRMNALMGFDDDENLIKKMIEAGTSKASYLLQRYKKIFAVGDVVLAGNDLAEIIEFKKSRYGYTSCKVRFLSQPPLPDVPEDWLPSSTILMLLPKSQVRNFLFKNRDNPETPQVLRDALAMMEKESDEVLVKLARDATLHLYQDGILIPMLLHSGIIKRREDLDED